MALIPQVVRNLLNDVITLDDVRAFDGTPIKLLPSVNVDLFALAADEDLAKSYHLSHLVATNSVAVVATANTSDTQATSTSLLEQWVLSTDKYVQFAPISAGPNTYSATVGSPFTVSIVVTNGIGIKDLINSVTTFQVSITGGGAPGAKIDGVAGPVTKTVVLGETSVIITTTGAGDVNLDLSLPTHPSVTLDVTDTAIVTFS